MPSYSAMTPTSTEFRVPVASATGSEHVAGRAGVKAHPSLMNCGGAWGIAAIQALVWRWARGVNESMTTPKRPTAYARYNRGTKTAKEVAAMTGTSERTARRWTRSEERRVGKEGGSRREAETVTG